MSPETTLDSGPGTETSDSARVLHSLDRSRPPLAATSIHAAAQCGYSAVNGNGSVLQSRSGVDIQPSGRSHAPRSASARESSVEPGDELHDVVNFYTGSTEFHGSSGVIPFLSKLRFKAHRSQSFHGTHQQPYTDPPAFSLLSYIYGPQQAESADSDRTAPPTRHPLRQENLVLEKEAVQLYFRNLHIVHPFLDKGAFISRCVEEVWTRRSPDNESHTTARSHFFALYYAVMAVGLITADQMPITHGTDDDTYNLLESSVSSRSPPAQRTAELFYQRAKRHLGDVFQSTSVDGTAALFLLSVYCQNALRQHSCYLYSGMAIRTAIAVGIPCGTSKQSAKLSRLWWALYSHEMEMCASVGRLTALGSPHVYGIQWPDEDRDAPHALISPMVRFAVILKQIPQDWQQQAEATDVSARSMETTAIYDMLKAWRESLRPVLDIDQPSLTDPDWRLQQKVVLKLRFLNACIMLHRPYLLLLARNGLRTELMGHVHLCVEASISTVDTLYDSYLQRPFFRTWWYNAIYLLYACMAILYALLSDVGEWPGQTLIESAKRGLGILEIMKSNGVAGRIALVVREVLTIATDASLARSKALDRPEPGASRPQNLFGEQISINSAAARSDVEGPEPVLDWANQGVDLEDLFNNLVDSSLFADWLQDESNVEGPF